MCAKNLYHDYKKKNELPFRYEKIGRWFGKTTLRDSNENSKLRTAETEIDILCIDKKAENFLVGECKFKKTAFSYSEYLDVQAKLASLKKGSNFYYALFSESGFDEKIVDEAQKNELLLYTLEDIVGLT